MVKLNFNENMWNTETRKVLYHILVFIYFKTLRDPPKYDRDSLLGHEVFFFVF